MSNLRKAAEMALETLEEINKLSIGENAICLPAEIDNAMEVLRQALAQPEPVQFKCTVVDNDHPNGVPLSQWGRQPEQEPVAWVQIQDGVIIDIEYDDFQRDYLVPIYTAPPKREWVGLSKFEVDSWELPDCPTVFEFALFIEAKLKEKNT